MNVSGIELGLELCKAFGLDPLQVRRITVDCVVDEEATVTVFYALPRDNGLGDVISRYALSERSDG